MQPIDSAQYCGGSNASEFEKNKILKVLNMEGIEPAQTRGASPFVLTPK